MAPDAPTPDPSPATIEGYGECRRCHQHRRLVAHGATCQPCLNRIEAARWVERTFTVSLDVGSYGEDVDDEEITYLLRMGGIDAEVIPMPDPSPDTPSEQDPRSRRRADADDQRPRGDHVRDRDEIVQTAKAIVKQLQPLTNDDTVELLLQRLNDAKRGFPTGGEPPAATDDVDEDGNPTTSAVRHSDRTGQLATTDGRDLADQDRRQLLRTLDRAWQLKKELGVLMERYGQVHPDNACIECRKVGTLRPIERARSATRCRFHADAYIANNKRDTPPAITDAYLIWGAKGLTDRVLDNNLIVILDAAGNDTGRRVRWQRRKKSKGRDVA